MSKMSETNTAPDMRLPGDASDRKRIPLWSGLFQYFPDALIAVAELSFIGNEQHNPGQPLHWAREKSTDHADCLLRHQMEVGTIDKDGVRHAAKVAWRSLAQLQLEIERSKPKQILVKPPLPALIPMQAMTEPAEPRCGCVHCVNNRFSGAGVQGYTGD